jgi:tRNA pseudouridine13 synthase
LLDRSHRRSIVTYLADKPPDRPDYRGAFSKLKVDLRGIYLAAFQSFLWNRMLARFMRHAVPAEHIANVALQLDPAPFFTALSAEEKAILHGAELLLPSARLHLDEGPMLALIRDVLGEVGLELRELRVKFPRDSFFSKGARKAVVPVGNLSHELAADEIYEGRRKLKLSFELPRGAYATILVKRLTACGFEEPA